MGKQKPNFKIAFVIATKDRPSELRNLLKSLSAQLSKPDQVVIIDSSRISQYQITNEFPSLSILYKQFSPPSATKQRNAGLLEVNNDIELVGFIDDDVEFDPHALSEMRSLWEEDSADLGGASFNMANHPDLDFSVIKTSTLSRMLGLYSKEKGMVLPTGFHTMIGNTDRNINVHWLPSGAVLWRKKVFDRYRFDEWFEGYSYLEDLDFSYQIGKEFKLVVCAAAKYYHYPAPSGRGTPFAFGKREVINRIYFVKKHKELSLSRCYAAIMVRIFLSLSFAFMKRDFQFVKRAFGSLVGVLNSIYLRSGT